MKLDDTEEMPPTTETFKQRRIFIKFNKLNNMNVTLYGKADRTAKVEILSDGDVDPNIAFNYSYPASKGILVVAFPLENQETEFEFEYWA